MAKGLHHIEIIPGKNGHTVRHFYAVNERGPAAYQSESHVFGNAEDVANHVEDALKLYLHQGSECPSLHRSDESGAR